MRSFIMSSMVVLVLIILACTTAEAQQRSAGDRATRGIQVVPVEGKRQKWALLVGVGDYANAERFAKLSYCGGDVDALKGCLVRYAGYPTNHVFVLHDKQSEVNQMPLRQVILRTLNAFLDLAGPEDQVLVAFSLHGTEVKGTPYLCPVDADPDKPADTMLSVPWLYETLKVRCRAAQKIVILDACRKELPDHSRGAAGQEGMSKALADSIRDVPTGLLVLSSCTAGQVSYEDPGICHGVFVNFVLQGLTGQADSPKNEGNNDGRVDVSELFNYAAIRTKAFVLEKYRGAQTPEMRGELTGRVFLTDAGASRLNATDGEAAPQFGGDLKNDEERLATAVNMAKVAVRQAEGGEGHRAKVTFLNAINTADHIQEQSLKDNALAEIAKSQVDAKDFLAAANTCQKIVDKRLQCETVCAVARGQAAAGYASSAHDTMHMLEDDHSNWRREYLPFYSIISETMQLISQRSGTPKRGSRNSF